MGIKKIVERHNRFPYKEQKLNCKLTKKIVLNYKFDYIGTDLNLIIIIPS